MNNIDKIHLKTNLNRKRNEEYIKFVILRGFKFLLKKLKEKNNYFITGTKLGDDEYFYKYYFE